METQPRRSNAEIQADQEELARQYEQYAIDYNNKRYEEDRAVQSQQWQGSVDVAARIREAQEARAQAEEQELASKFPATPGVDEQVVELVASKDLDSIKTAAETKRELIAKVDDVFIPLDFRDSETASYENLRERDRHVVAED